MQPEYKEEKPCTAWQEEAACKRVFKLPEYYASANSLIQLINLQNNGFAHRGGEQGKKVVMSILHQSVFLKLESCK